MDNKIKTTALNGEKGVSLLKFNTRKYALGGGKWINN
jgi:hypothetical protein